MAGCRFDHSGHRLGMVGRDPVDESLCRSASLVNAGTGSGGSGNLSGTAQSAGHLDFEIAATDLGTFASVDARAWRQVLASGCLDGPGGGWFAGERAANKGQRESVMCSELRKERVGEVPPPAAEKSRGSLACEEVRTSEAADLDHAVMAYGSANALELENGAFEFERTRSFWDDARRTEIPEKHAVLCRCRLYRVRSVEGDHRPGAFVLDSRWRECDAASQAWVCSGTGRDRLFLARPCYKESTTSWCCACFA